MGEKMARAEVTPGIIGPSEEEIKSLTGKGAKEGLIPWIPKRLKIAMGVAVGLGATGTVGAAIWEATHPPAITEPVSAAQIPPAPEIAVPPQAEEAPKYIERASPTQDFLVQIRAPEPIIPVEKQAEAEVVAYEIQPGDTLISIAEKFNLPWQVLYGKDIIEIGYTPDNIKAGGRLTIPDIVRDKELIEKLNPEKISEEQFPSIDLLSKQDPEKLKELRWRAVAVVAYDLNERQIFFEDWREFRDFRIFDFHGNFLRGRELNYVNVLETLAQYELEFERNPVIERVLQEMTPGIRAMNKILRDKASPEWFKNGKIPQLPEDLSGRFVFEEGILPGLGWPYYPSVSLLGEYDSYEMVKQRLLYTGFHELIHSILQFESAIKPSPWIEQPEENKQGLLKSENRRIHLAHEALDVLTLPAMEATGRPPTKIDSRILYIYWVLKREGVEDPYKEILSAAVTMNGDRLWQVYELARRPNDFSMDELFTYQERSPDGFYNNFDQEKALEELRAEYLPHLSE